MKILMVLTSHENLGDTGKKTGFWLEEFASPYYAFKDAGADITLASPLAVNHRLTQKVMSQTLRPNLLNDLSKMPPPKNSWQPLINWLILSLPIMMQYSIQAVMAQCGIWQLMSNPSH